MRPGDVPRPLRKIPSLLYIPETPPQTHFPPLKTPVQFVDRKMGWIDRRLKQTLRLLQARRWLLEGLLLERLL